MKVCFFRSRFSSHKCVNQRNQTSVDSARDQDVTRVVRELILTLAESANGVQSDTKEDTGVRAEVGELHTCPRCITVLLGCTSV